MRCATSEAELAPGIYFVFASAEAAPISATLVVYGDALYHLSELDAESCSACRDSATMSGGGQLDPTTIPRDTHNDAAPPTSPQPNLATADPYEDTSFSVIENGVTVKKRSGDIFVRKDWRSYAESNQKLLPALDRPYWERSARRDLIFVAASSLVAARRAMAVTFTSLADEHMTAAAKKAAMEKLAAEERVVIDASDLLIAIIQSKDEEVDKKFDKEIVRRALSAAREAVTDATIMLAQAQGRPLHFEVFHRKIEPADIIQGDDYSTCWIVGSIATVA
jgi:hypothetical protein